MPKPTKTKRTSSSETKPAIYTTEFWSTIITQIFLLLQISGINDVDITTASQNKYVLIAMAIMGGAYNVARGKAKQGVPYFGPVGEVPGGVIDEAELEAGDLDGPEDGPNVGTSSIGQVGPGDEFPGEDRPRRIR